MSTIVTRTGKGTALTWVEADTNFTNLNTDKVEYASLAADSGSSLVGFLPDGIGAVGTDVQSELEKGFTYAANFPTLQEAINAASTSHQKTLVLDAGATYVNSAALTITTSGLKIIGNGATIDGSARSVGANATDTYALCIAGSVGANVNVISDIAAGDNRIFITSTTGILAGDYILVKSTQQYPTGATGTASYKGQIMQVRSVASATELVLQEGVLFSITALVTAVQNAYVAKLTLVDDVQINDLKIKMGGTGKAHVGIKISYALNPRLTNCETALTESVGVFTEYVVGGGVYGGTFSGATSPAAGGGPVVTQYGYGILPGTAVKGFVVSGAMIKNCRHCIAGGGSYPAIAVRVENCMIDGTRLATASHLAGYALDCHEDCTFWVFDGNTIFSHRQANASAFVDGDGGIIIRGRHTSVTNNKIYNMAKYGIRVRNTDGSSSFSSGNLISGNTIGGCLRSGILIEGGGAAAVEYDHVVADNFIYDCAENGIQITSADNVIVSGNNIRCDATGTQGISINGEVTNYSSNIVIEGNCITESLDSGIFADYVRNMVINNNRVTGSSDDCIQLVDCQNVTLSGNVLSTDVDVVDGISVSGVSSAISITGCVITKSVAAGVSSSGIKALNVTDLVINGCIASGYINGFYADSTCNWVVVTGNNGRNCTASTVIHGAIVNKSVANNL